jgi:hypothetical protein
MLCSENNESRNEGIKHMRYLRMTKCIMHSRKKMPEIREYLWKYNGLLVRNQTLVCKQRPTCGGWRVKRGKWCLQNDEDDDLSSCENCRWDYELQFIYSIFSVPWISIWYRIQLINVMMKVSSICSCYSDYDLVTLFCIQNNIMFVLFFVNFSFFVTWFFDFRTLF